MSQWSPIIYRFSKMVKNKKPWKNPKNNDDKCFQLSVTVDVNYQSIKENREGRTKIKPFINQYNWEEKSFPLHEKIRKR